jgi:hypothetical protein
MLNLNNPPPETQHQITYWNKTLNYSFNYPKNLRIQEVITDLLQILKLMGYEEKHIKDEILLAISQKQ